MTKRKRRTQEKFLEAMQERVPAKFALFGKRKHNLTLRPGSFTKDDRVHQGNVKTSYGLKTTSKTKKLLSLKTKKNN